ncbi:MAG: TadE family protein [Pseudomonadota bacterium]
MKKRQQGLTTVEAAIGAAVMLTVLFGAIEVSRLVFVWNFLDEVTRRGARVAAVCPFDHPAVRRVAIFSEPDGLDSSPRYIKGLTTSEVTIEYLDAAGDDSTTNLEPGETPLEKTKFVRASINNFQLPLLLFNKATLNAPPFTTILPSESLGYNPDTTTCRCFSTPGSWGVDGCDSPP